MQRDFDHRLEAVMAFGSSNLRILLRMNTLDLFATLATQDLMKRQPTQ